MQKIYHISYRKITNKIVHFQYRIIGSRAYKFDLSRRSLQCSGHPQILTHSRLARMQEVQNTETKSARKVKKSREVNTQEAQEYLMRPIPKISDPNKALKKAYEKGHLDDSKFEYMKELKDIRAKKKDDSVSSHGATDDEDFNIVEEQARKVPKQVNAEEDQNAEKATKKKRKIRFAVKLQKAEFEQKNEENVMEQGEIDSANAKENITKNEENQERESQQSESKSTEKMQEMILGSLVIAQPKEKKVSKPTGRRNKKAEAIVKLPQGDIQPTDKAAEEKAHQSGSVSKPIPCLQASKQPNSQAHQAQSDQAKDPKMKQKSAQQNTMQKRLTRQSVMQAEMRKEQQKGQTLKQEGKDIIKSRTKNRQRRVRISANGEDEKKPVQKRRRNRQQNSVSIPKEKVEIQAENTIQVQPAIASNAQANVVVKQKRAARRTNPTSSNTEKPTKPSNSRPQSKVAPQTKVAPQSKVAPQPKIAPQSKVAHDQVQPKQAEKTPEPDRKSRLSITSKVVIESLNFFELKRKSSIKQKKKHAKKYYVQSQSEDDEEYPQRRRKASKAKRYRKICIEESDDSSDDIIERRRRHSRKDKQRRKRQYSSSDDDMSEVSETHLYRTNQHHYRSRDPKELKFELKQEQR